jgi:hypothetical protein
MPNKVGRPKLAFDDKTHPVQVRRKGLDIKKLGESAQEKTALVNIRKKINTFLDKELKKRQAI